MIRIFKVLDKWIASLYDTIVKPQKDIIDDANIKSNR